MLTRLGDLFAQQHARRRLGRRPVVSIFLLTLRNEWREISLITSQFVSFLLLALYLEKMIRNQQQGAGIKAEKADLAIENFLILVR